MNSLYVVHLELAMVFISLVLRPLLKLSIFFSYVSTNPRAQRDKLLNACMYSVRVLVPCVNRMNSAAFMRISPGECGVP